MPIVAISKDQLTDRKEDFKIDGNRVFLSPLPVDDLASPIPWFDLHVAEGGTEDYYEVCGDPRHRPFLEDSHGRFVPVSPGRAVRLFTREVIGVPTGLTGIVANTYRFATRGLVIPIGKVDPGFGPAELSLIVANHSTHALKVRAGEKAICLGFAEVKGTCLPTHSPGWAKIPAHDDYGWGSRFGARLRSIDTGTLLATLVGSLIGAFAFWALQHL